jgi:hypothetical protein
LIELIALTPSYASGSSQAQWQTALHRKMAVRAVENLADKILNLEQAQILKSL